LNQITVLFFATLRDKAGMRMLKLEVGTDITLEKLKLIIVDSYPALKGLLEHSLASINHEYRFDDDRIPDGAEIAFFPPVSGG